MIRLCFNRCRLIIKTKRRESRSVDESEQILPKSLKISSKKFRSLKIKTNRSSLGFERHTPSKKKQLRLNPHIEQLLLITLEWYTISKATR